MQIIGSKKGQSQPQKPHIAKDDLNSSSFYKGLYGLCEGEIEGLADGEKSIKLDGTPLINANGQPNFKGVTWDFRTGTLDQTHIAGFPAVENEQNIGVELRHDRPYTKAINNKELSAVRVRLNLNALREQKDNGDIVGYAIEYAIDLQTDTGAFVEVLRQVIRGKASNGFKRSHRIDLPPAKKGWTIRIRRITPNRDSDLVADTMTVDAITEIIDAKLAYPCTALLGLTYDAKTFSNIAKLAVRLKGKIIQVPTNYNPQTRQYTGLWDGTFKMAYSNNPAWVFYDLCTHRRYGLGERLSGMVDKWRLYQIGQYCDEMVDDGKGGKEPRFTVNVYIQKAEDAYKVLQNLASVFRGMSFWDGQNIVVDSDTPKEPVYTFSPANIVGGEFTYQGTRDKDRHTVAKVAWDNPDNDFKTEYEPVTDKESLATYGFKQLDINAFGCTSLGQAQRAGLWALKSEQLETRSVTFKTGLQGFIPQVGQVINIADDVFAGRAISGRIVNVNGKQITLDRVAGKIGDTLTVATADGVLSAKITAINGETLTLQQTLNVESQSVWAIVSDDLKLMQFRILTIEQHDNATFDITALQYEPQKFDVVDNSVHITPQPYSVLKATPITAPNSVTLTASTRTVQGQAVTTLNINWGQVQGAVAYLVKWRKDDGNWITLPKVSGQSVDIDGVYAGNYLAQVQAIDSFDNESLPATSVLTTINGKVGKPPRLAKLAVKGILFGMELNWAFARGSEDTNFTEIQVSPDGRSNIASLGTFSYPTNSHTINGLQGNLTQFYRARIVDKLGNTSDWTAWVRGTTEAQADKVLNLIQGQINENHLHTTLSTPIAKIGTLETDLNGVKTQLPTLRNDITNAKTTLQNAIDAVNAQLPTLNGQIATLNGKATTLQNELNTAKNTLQTAVGNITTERNRISTAIRDITALQSANTAKTQEIANLTNTVGGHTSSIRELGVTTGDLSQKYTALKTATDTANSEITAIKQTQSGQATSIERLGARFDNLGNLLHQNALTVGQFWHHTKNRAEIANTHSLSDFIPTIPNVRYIIRANTGVVVDIRLAWFDSGQNFVSSRYEHNNMSSYEFVATGEFLRISYNHTRGTDFELTQFAHHQITANTNAKLDEFKQAQVNKDLAISQRITALDTAYKNAGSQTTAKLGQIEQSISDKDRAMSQRVDTLSANFTTLDNRTKWVQLTAVTDLNNLTETGKYFIRASSNPNAPFAQWTYVVVEKARNDRITQTAWADNNASLVYTRVYNGAWQAWEKTATGKELDTKASVASLNEFKQTSANADTALGERITAIDTAYKQADTATNAKIANAEKAISDNNSALSQRITALDTAYKSADNNLTARLAREETARASGNNANSQAIRTLESTVSGISGRVGTSESKIATLERTTSDTNQALATAQSQLNARFDSLAVGGRNYLLNSDFVIAKHDGGNLRSQSLAMSNAIKTIATPCTITVSAHFKLQNVSELTNDVRMLFLVRFTHADGTVTAKQITYNAKTRTDIDKRLSAQVEITKPITGFAHTYIDVYGITAEMASIARPQIEKGTIATDWTPAPEDLQSEIDGKASTANLETLRQTLTNADTALGQRITAIDTAYKSADSQTVAKLGQIEQSISDKDRAMSQRVDTLSANFTTLDNRTKWVQLTAVTDLNNLTETGKYFIRASSNPNAPFTNWAYVVVEKARNDRTTQTAWADNNASLVYTRVYNGAWQAWEKTATGKELDTKATTASLNEFRQAQAQKDTATAQKLSQLESNLGTKANTTALDSLATKVNQADGKITAEAQKVSTLQTTVNGQTASIQQQATSIDGLKAQYTVKIDSGGRVSGFGLASGGGVSDFSVRADKFLIAPPSGNGKGDSPFMVLTKPTNINGTVVPSGTYIKNAYIANGSIDNLKVKDGAISTAKIAEASITNAKIMDLAVDTIKIRDRAVTVPHTFTDTNPRNFENKRIDAFEKSETGWTVPEISEWVLHGLTPNTEVMVIVDVGRLSMFIRRPDNIAYSKDYDCAVRLGVGYMTTSNPDDWDILNHSNVGTAVMMLPDQNRIVPLNTNTTQTFLSGAFFRRLTVPADGTVDLNLWCSTYGSVDDRTIITAKTDKVTWYVLELKK